MNEDLLQVRNWCVENRLLLNPDKTKLIVFGSWQMTSKLHEFHLSLLGKDISPVQSARDLGLILNPNLTFDNHITTSVSECIARLAQINRVKHCLDKNTLLTVIHALVFSKMYYCSNVWANITNKNVRKLQAVQNFACRIVSGEKKIWSCNTSLKKACLGGLLRSTVLSPSYYGLQMHDRSRPWISYIPIYYPWAS